jgi:hypothetical protein
VKALSARCLAGMPALLFCMLLVGCTSMPDLPFGEADRAAVLLALGEPVLSLDQDTVLVHAFAQGSNGPKMFTRDAVYVLDRGVWVRRGLQLGYRATVSDSITIHEFDRDGKFVRWVHE